MPVTPTLRLPTGLVKWFNNQKGYGFIQSPAIDRDIFFHHTAVERKAGELFVALTEGDVVEFNISLGPKGPMASFVRVVG